MTTTSIRNGARIMESEIEKMKKWIRYYEQQKEEADVEIGEYEKAITEVEEAVDSLEENLLAATLILASGYPLTGYEQSVLTAILAFEFLDADKKARLNSLKLQTTHLTT
jgi:glycyl-tRNA synthetase alpha subunit